MKNATKAKNFRQSFAWKNRDFYLQRHRFFIRKVITTVKCSTLFTSRELIGSNEHYLFITDIFIQ